MAPLTGKPDPSGDAQRRAALTAKIENIPAAMPQRGIDKADVIYEEIVEGCITRLAAVFNSQIPPVIGPLRSVRRTDREIVWPYKGIFVYSGGAIYAQRSIATVPGLLRLDETSAGAAMFRDNHGRVPPDNLYGYGPKLIARGGSPVPPPALFTYRSALQKVTGTPVTSLRVGFIGGYDIEYGWNAATQSWDRTQFQAPDIAVDGARISPRNVIVQFVNYRGGVCVEGAEAQLVGTGKVAVFTDGKEIIGTWKRASLDQRTGYYDAKGRKITLTPGQTVVELLNTGWSLTVHSPVPATTTTSPQI